jgi:hypothetical protein
MYTERAEASFPLRATTTAADPKRDARAAQRHSCERRKSRAAARSRLARRCPGRANEQACFSPASEGGRRRLTSASLSERSEQRTRSERRRSFLCERRRRRRIPSAMREQLRKPMCQEGYLEPRRRLAARSRNPSSNQRDRRLRRMARAALSWLRRTLPSQPRNVPVSRGLTQMPA